MNITPTASLPLKERLFRYLEARPGVRVPSGELQRLVTEKTTYTAANATRRLRELAEDGRIKVEQVKGHAHYWYEAPSTKTVRRIEYTDTGVREIIETITV